MYCDPPQEIVSEASFKTIHRIEESKLDALEAYHMWGNFLRSAIDLQDVSWNIKRELLQELAINPTRLCTEVEQILNNPLILSIKEGNLKKIEHLLKESKNLESIDPHYPLIKFLIDWVDYYEEETPLKILKLLKKNKAVVTEECLLRPLSFHSAFFICELFEDQKIVWSQKFALRCLLNALNRDEKLIWETLKKAGWPFNTLLDVENRGILRMAIEERNLTLVRWLLSQEAFPIQERDRIAAWECCDLEIMECFFSTQEIVQQWLDQITSLKEQFQSYFVYSRLGKIQEYLIHLKTHSPRMGQDLEDIYRSNLNHSALFARYNRNKDTSSLSALRGITLTKYVQNQMAFASFCNQAVQEKLQDLKNGETELLQAIKKFAEARYKIAINRSEDSSECFIELRIGKPDQFLYTPFGSLSKQRSHYSFTIPWIKSVMQKSSSKELEKEANGYTLCYWDEEVQQSYSLTQVDFERGIWIQSSPEKIAALWPKLQKIHEELLTPLNVHDPSQVCAFQVKVATAYWLGCHLMVTYRGNAQYFLMWLSTLLRHHRFEPLIAKRETPMPDCLALSLPLSEFIAFFPSFFENPLFAEGRCQTRFQL